jgi:hypothetical protein
MKAAEYPLDPGRSGRERAQPGKPVEGAVGRRVHRRITPDRRDIFKVVSH